MPEEHHGDEIEVDHERLQLSGIKLAKEGDKMKSSF